MRIWTIVEPLDMTEIPRPGLGIGVAFGDHLHMLHVVSVEHLGDGTMWLECDLAGAQMDGELLPTPTGQEQLFFAYPRLDRGPARGGQEPETSSS
jgi:hypothetical protein